MQRRRQGEHTVHIRHGLRRARIRKRRWCQQTRGAPSHAAGRGPHTPRTDRHACTFTTTSHSTLLPHEAPQDAKRDVQYKQDYIKAAPHAPLAPGFQVSHHRWRSRSWRHTQESAPPHCDDNKQQKSAAAGDSAERKGATTQIKRLRQRPRQRCWTNTWGSARTKRAPADHTRANPLSTALGEANQVAQHPSLSQGEAHGTRPAPQGAGRASELPPAPHTWQ